METLLRGVVEDAVGILKAGLDVYWPAEGKNEMPEAHTLGAIGQALSRRRFHVFAEVYCQSNEAGGHVDLFAIDEPVQMGIAFEGKRLYNAAQAALMVADWERLGRARLAAEHGPLPKLARCYRMIVATTWDTSISAWWRRGGVGATPSPGLAWDALGAALCGSMTDAARIQADAHWGEQWLLWSAAERGGSFFAELPGE